MKVHVSPSMQTITISTRPGYFSNQREPVRLRINTRNWSYRCVFLILLALAFAIPALFITAALFSLGSPEDCGPLGCTRKFAGRLKPLFHDKDHLWENTNRGRGGGIHVHDPKGFKDDPVLTVDELFAKAESQNWDRATFLAEVKGLVDLHDEKARTAKLQRTLFRHFASKGIPRGLHCLSLRLTAEFARNVQAHAPLPEPGLAHRLTDNSLHHFSIVTDNVLAASVVVQSTISNAARPEMVVFHVITDETMYPAMYAWFALHRQVHSPAVVEVRGIHQLAWLSRATVPILDLVETSPFLRRHYFGEHVVDWELGHEALPAVLAAKLQARSPKYISIMNHLRMYLPEVFPQLNKVVFLDDDTVVQRDLGPLWAVDLKGRVNGAVETCHGADRWVMSKRFKSYFNFSHPVISRALDPERCAWAYGMNVFDLAAWRKSSVKEVYHQWQRMNVELNLTLWRLGTLPPALIAFDGQVQPIDSSWHMLGLGYQPESDPAAIASAAVLHFNGPAKPWLDMGIPEYKPLWNKYVDYQNEHVRRCNILQMI